MARINDEQLAALADVGRLYQARRDVDKFVMMEIDRLIAERRAEVNIDLYPAVVKAIELGVPKSRIGRAIGTSAHITYNKLIQDALDWKGQQSSPGNVTAEASVSFRAGDAPESMVVSLENYMLEGSLVSGEFVFVNGMYQGDVDDGFKVERALFGDTPDEVLVREMRAE